MKYLIVLTSTLLLFASCAKQQSTDSSITSPKNIILLIGDGMGLSEVSASIYYNDTTSNFENFPIVGLSKTSSSSDLITDSAAGATAFAAGIKTYNGAISVNPDSIAAPTLFEHLHKKGYKTGVISTSSIVHATPAAFYAHVNSRRDYETIAQQLAASDVHFFAGGGTQFFNERTDSLQLLNTLTENGFEVHTQLLPEETQGKQAILLAKDAMPRMLDGRGSFLPDATKLALANLATNKDGFILVVEGSQIDWGGHARDGDYLISEQLDFDKTVGVALEFAAAHKETLVLVTADHETGGFTLSAKEGNYNENEYFVEISIVVKFGFVISDLFLHLF